MEQIIWVQKITYITVLKNKYKRVGQIRTSTLNGNLVHFYHYFRGWILTNHVTEYWPTSFQKLQLLLKNCIGVPIYLGSSRLTNILVWLMFSQPETPANGG